MRQQDAIIQMLKEKGLRVTPQRFAVYANLLERCDHPTADQVLHDLNRDAPTSSQSTVYTSLQALCAAGLVREVILDEGVCRYDANVAPHHHFRCHDCGTIRDIAWDALPGLAIGQSLPGIQIDSYEIILHGRCEQC
jgi:Fur family transcriptional regulator, peroxide stress response regulator